MVSDAYAQHLLAIAHSLIRRLGFVQPIPIKPVMSLRGMLSEARSLVMPILSGSCRVWQQWGVQDGAGAGAGVGAAMVATARMEAMRIEERILEFE